MQNTQKSDTDAGYERTEQAKLPYQQPVLEKYGSVANITGGLTSGTIDSLFGGIGGFQDFS